MIKAYINGKEGLFFYDERIPLENAPHGYPYMYHLRHDEDDWTKPIHIERLVIVNFFGTVFLKEKLHFNRCGYFEIEKIELDCNYAKININHNLLENLFGLGENKQVLLIHPYTSTKLKKITK